MTHSSAFMGKFAKGVIIMAVLSGISVNGASTEQGIYFAKKKYVPKPLPVFENTEDKLPAPIYDEDPNYVSCYWKAWELAFKNFHEPNPESGFVSQYIDAAFNQNIFLWDSCFLTMFCNYAHPYVPGIGTLDNFYAKQYEDGEICREIDRKTGKGWKPWINKEDIPLFTRWGCSTDEKEYEVFYRGRDIPKPNPKLTLDALNHPILAWAEVESYRHTADRERLELVWEPLVRYYQALQKYIRQGNGLYMTDWASMDNSPRNIHLKGGGTGIDISCEMVLFARNLTQIAEILGETKEAQRYNSEAEQLSALINKHMWDGYRQFYFDLTLEGERAPVKSIAAFWALLAKVAPKPHADALTNELVDPDTFKTVHRVPTLAANEEVFHPKGGYWRGVVWAPTEKMVIQGLENYGYDGLAREIAMNHLACVVDVYKESGTIWENYAPQSVSRGSPSRKDFVGWSGLGPIAFLIEYAIRIKADAPGNLICWNIHSDKRVGIKRFWFGGNTVSLVCEEAASDGKRLLRIQSEKAFRLTIRRNGKTTEIQIPAADSFQVQI